MGVEPGTIGVWRSSDQLTPELAVELERLGYGRIWLGGSPDAGLALAERLLNATTTLRVATGIVNIWMSEPEVAAASYHRLEERHPGRFLLGIGAGHREATGDRYAKPYEALEAYLDVLDAEGVPRERRVLAALGPRVLRLARDRAAGAHPYLVTPAHTEGARAVLGPDRLLVPEQKVVVETDPEAARATGRLRLAMYLRLGNYLANLRREGFTDEDFADGGSDRLVDALAVHGSAPRVAETLRAHLAAGANEVALQLLTPDSESPLPAFRALAESLHA